MFYPVESLRKGGRFYLCWVADSWPLRFANITQKQLWSQDVRTICNDLQKVINSESGRPTKRFSLRLSSQLMRGLVRLYQKKVTVFLVHLCTINATIFKKVNKKLLPCDLEEIQNVLATDPLHFVQEIPKEEHEERIEEIIQQSGNVVNNIQDITLKEATIPEVLLPVNDNFGEEHPEQVLQMLELTVEQMLQAGGEVTHHSGVEAGAGAGVSAASILVPLNVEEHRMERLSDLNATLFSKSMLQETMQEDLEKDIPRTPEILLPQIPPSPEKVANKDKEMEVDEPELDKEVLQRKTSEDNTQQFQLQELEETTTQVRRRRKINKLIIDKKIKLSSEFLRSRIDNPAVELRCEESIDDVVNLSVTAEMYFRRPAHAGYELRPRLGLVVGLLFERNLAVVARLPATEKDAEQAMVPTTRQTRSKYIPEPVIDEQVIAVPEIPRIEVSIAPEVSEPPALAEKSAQIETAQTFEIPHISIQEIKEPDISLLPTQVVETLSQQKRRLTVEHEQGTKRARRSGYLSFRESQQAPIEVPIGIGDLPEANKENIPYNNQECDVERAVTSLLQEAGLADIQESRRQEELETAREATQRTAREATQRTTREATQRMTRERSETPLGSLDRTKVSLGESEATTDSKRFIRDEWGTEGTMFKVLHLIRNKKAPITVKALVDHGPVISGYKSIIAARCFTSLLKLKQHDFVKVVKDPDTCEILDILLGPIFKRA